MTAINEYKNDFSLIVAMFFNKRRISKQTEILEVQLLNCKNTAATMLYFKTASRWWRLR